jgi:hypothetical protein
MIDATVWTCIEPAVGILATCLSNMRPLARYISRTPDIPPYHRHSSAEQALHPGHTQTQTVTQTHSPKTSTVTSSPTQRGCLYDIGGALKMGRGVGEMGDGEKTALPQI